MLKFRAVYEKLTKTLGVTFDLTTPVDFITGLKQQK